MRQAFFIVRKIRRDNALRAGAFSRLRKPRLLYSLNLQMPWTRAEVQWKRNYLLHLRVMGTSQLIIGDLYYTAKLVPHPQVLLALGLLKVNPRLFRPSIQSTCIPYR